MNNKLEAPVCIILGCGFGIILCIIFALFTVDQTGTDGNKARDGLLISNSPPQVDGVPSKIAPSTSIVPTFEDLLDAIEQVESGGDADSVGDNGRAVGTMQIWKIYVDDVNRILGKNWYSYGDRGNREKSREMVTVYLRHYATAKRLGREPTFEDMAAMHCAGPNGYLQKDELAVKKYLEKVKKELDKL